MSIENLLRDFILSNYRSLRSFAVKNNLPPTTITTLLQHSVDKSSFQSVVAICQALHISIEALANGEIVRIDGSGQPLPVLPPHDQALLDAYHAMSSQEQRLICRTLGISMPEENNPKGK